jgi:hypothetical protein
MKKFGLSVAGVCLLAVSVLAGKVAAQEKEMSGPPKILTVAREFVKPGKNGQDHEKTESMFVEAMRKAKWPTTYLGMESLSGKNRALFLTGYESFDAWEKDVAGEQKNPVLAASLQRAYTADAVLLDSFETSVWMYRPDMSMNPPADVSGFRLMEFDVFHIKPGQEAEWDEAVKMVKEAYGKVPDTHWAMYQMLYGGGGVYVVITPMSGGAEIDKGFAADKQFAEAMGADGMKRLSELSRMAVESRDNELFLINAHMSYVSDDVANKAPDFWKPKATHAAAGSAKKDEKKPEVTTKP